MSPPYSSQPGKLHGEENVLVSADILCQPDLLFSALQRASTSSGHLRPRSSKQMPPWKTGKGFYPQRGLQGNSLQAWWDGQMHNNFEGRRGLKAAHLHPFSPESPSQLHSRALLGQELQTGAPQPRHSPPYWARHLLTPTLPPPVMAGAPRPPHVTPPAGEGGERRRCERSRGAPPRASGARRRRRCC